MSTETEITATIEALRAAPAYSNDGDAIEYVAKHAAQIPAILTSGLEQFKTRDQKLLKVRDTLTEDELDRVADIATVRLIDCAIMDGPRSGENVSWDAFDTYTGFGSFEKFATFHLENIMSRLMLQLLADRSPNGDAAYILS